MKSNDFAKQMELDGEKFYRELAEKIENASLKALIQRLADDEREHARLISIRGAYAGDAKHMEAIEPRENVFDYLKEYEYIPSDDDHEELYRLAHKAETDSVRLYKELIEKSDNQSEKEFFEFILKKELYHIEVIDSLFKGE